MYAIADPVAQVRDILMKVFSKPHKVKYGNIHLLAILLGAIYRYHPAFVVSVIDNVVEAVSWGLELNEFKHYQKRIAEVKYLGELYNYRMLEHPVIFDTLYKMMTFGYGGPPVPGRINPFDMPDDFFRIRLASTMLDTCGMYFKSGAAGKKLDYFLSFFQYYIYTKNPLPMDIEFIVQDVYELTRPQWKLATNLEEATKAFQLAVAQDQKSMGLDKAGEPDEQSSGSSSDDDGGDEDLRVPDAEELGSDDEGTEVRGTKTPGWTRCLTSETQEGDGHNSSRASDSGEEEEAIVVTRKEENIDPEYEAEFEREFAKMMAESLESRKFERKPLFDVPLPVRPKAKEAQAATEGGDGAEPSPSATTSFSLLTKKGNRQQVWIWASGCRSPG